MYVRTYVATYMKYLYGRLHFLYMHTICMHVYMSMTRASSSANKFVALMLAKVHMLVKFFTQSYIHTYVRTVG